MVIKFELRCVEQIVTSACFWPKKVECLNIEDDCVPNGSTDKIAAWGGSYLFMKYDVFRHNAELFIEIESNIFKYEHYQISRGARVSKLKTSPCSNS